MTQAQKLNTISSNRVFMRGCVFALFVTTALAVLSSPVKAEMVLFWNFDEYTTVDGVNYVTDSVHSERLKLVNSSIVDGQLSANGGYAQGTGTNNGTTTALPLGSSTTPNYTLSAFLTTTRNGAVGIISWGVSGSTRQTNSFRTDGAGLKNYWWGDDLAIGGYPEVYSGYENYVVATGVGKTQTLYLNGQLIGTRNAGGNRNEENRAFTVGNTVNNNTETLYGSIDNASVYNDAMDQKDIVNIAAHTYNGLTNWWKAGETVDRVGGVVKPETVTGTTVITGTSGQVMVFNRELTAGEQAYYEGQLATGHDYVIDNMAGSASTKTTWLRTSSADLSSATQTPLGIYVGGTTTASTLTATLDQINAVNRTVVMGGGTLALTLSGDASLDAYRVNFNSGSLSLSGSGELTLNSADKRVPLRNLAVAANTSFVVNTEKNVDIFGVISGAGNISLPANVTATFYNKSDHAFTGVLEAPKGGNLVLANQDVFNDSGYNGSYSLIADGTTITNSGAYFNYLTNVTLKNGAKIYAADGNSAWKAYKFLNLNVVRNSDNSPASLVTIDSNRSNANTTISFAPQTNQLGTAAATIYVEDITASSGSSDSLPDLTISAIITDPSINNNGATKANAIEKTGNGTLRLAAPNTFNGDLTITAGTVVMAANCNGSSTTATPLGNPSNADRKITVKSGAVLETESSNAGIDVFGGAEAHPKFTIVADGGTIATSSNTLTTYGDIELKNGGVFEERGGNSTWLTIFNGDISVTSGNATIQSTSSGRGISLRGYRDGTNAGVKFDVAENSTLTVSALLKNCPNRGVAGSFTKTGKGTMILSNRNNDFTGNIVVDEGILKAQGGWQGVNKPSVLGQYGSRTVTVNSGAEFVFASQDVISNADAIYPMKFIVNGGTITNEGAVFNNLSNAEFSNGGKIVATNGNGDWKAFMVNGTTKIAFAGDGNTAESPVVFEVASTATGTAKTNATICPQTTFDVADVTKSDASDLIITAVLANASNRAGYFTKSGAGTMELTNNANSFTGNIVVNEGVLKASAKWTGVGTNKNTTVFGYYQSKTVTVNEGAEVILAAQDVVSDSSHSTPIQFILDGGKISNEGAVYNNLNNTVFKNGAELYASNGHNDWKAYKLSTKVSALRDKPSAQPVKITASDNGNATISFGDTTSLYVEDVTSASATELDTKSDLIISAKVTNPHNESNRTFYKDGVGTLEFTAANTFNGTVGIREGVLRLSGAGTLGTSAVNLVTDGTKHGTLEFKDSTATAIPSAISGAGDILVSSGTANLTGAVAQTGGSTILADGTTLNIGSDTVAVNPMLNNLAVTDEDSSATLTVYGDLTLNNDQMSKFIGSIKADTITKTGDETLKIYTGASGQVDAQSLIVSSGHLDLKGYMKGNITVDANTVFSPGNSIGEATYGGNYILNEGATLLMEIGGQGVDENDSLYNKDSPADAGKLIINGLIELTLADNSTLQGGDTFTAILSGSNSGDEGFGDDLLSHVQSYYFTDLRYVPLGDGNYAITGTLDSNAVPEPSTWALLILGAAGLMYWKKRNS